jgi:hypothetical protein
MYYNAGMKFRFGMSYVWTPQCFSLTVEGSDYGSKEEKDKVEQSGIWSLSWKDTY